MPPNKKHLLKSLTYLDYSKADRVQEGWNIEGGKVCKHAADCQNIHCGSTAEPCGTWSLKETETADRTAWRTSKFFGGVPCEQRSGTLRGKEWPQPCWFLWGPRVLWWRIWTPLWPSISKKLGWSNGVVYHSKPHLKQRLPIYRGNLSSRWQLHNVNKLRASSRKRSSRLGTIYLWAVPCDRRQTEWELCPSTLRVYREGRL